MHIKRYHYLALAFALTAAALWLFWAILPHSAQAQPALSPTPLHSPRLERWDSREVGEGEQTPDPRWQELLRSQPSHSRSSPQTAPLSLNINLTDYAVAGHAPGALPVEIEVRQNGARVAYGEAAPIPDQFGFFYIAWLDWENDHCCFTPGDEVWVTQAGNTLSMTIPALSGLADAQTDTVYGQAPFNEIVTLYLFPYAEAEASHTFTTTANAEGSYQADLSPTTDLRPRDTGYVAYAQDATRQVYTSFVAPFLRVHIKSWEVNGLAAPNSPVTITATTSDGMVIPEGHFLTTLFSSTRWQIRLGDRGQYGMTATPNSDISITLIPGDGSPTTTITTTSNEYASFYALFPRSIQSGDTLALYDPNETTSHVVPVLTAEHNYTRQTLEGEAPPGSLLLASFPTEILWYDAERHALVDGNGHYGMDTSDLELHVGFGGYVLLTDSRGNTVRRTFTIWGYRFFFPVVYGR